ncbi:MAG TPA: hypothetical protein VN946_13875 [Terriglobales bacterium]|jgi:hypothetical protein|nr:hypothetical protein [Terriglobales bacterium]
MGKNMKRALILLLVISTLAAARDKKPKPHPGPYVFTSKASAQTLKALIVQENLREGYTLDSDNQLQFRFSMPGQLPFMDSMLTITGICKGMTTRQVWSYSLSELNGTTKIIIQPVWEYPDEDCQIQTREFIWSQPEEIAAFQAMLDKAPTSSEQAPSATPVVASPATAPPSTPTSAPDQQQSMKQHAACVELAKDSPSITCK